MSGEEPGHSEERSDGELDPPTAELGIPGAAATASYASSNGHGSAHQLGDLSAEHDAPWERPELLLAAAFLTGLLLAVALKRRRR